MYTVENIEIDLNKYEGEHCLQVLAEYVDATTLNVLVKRIDTLSDEGWSDNVDVLLHDHRGNVHIIQAGMSECTIKRVENIHLPNFHLTQSFRRIDEEWYTSYKPFRKFEHYPQYIGIEQFNQLFNTNIVELPSSLYAVGMKDGGAYIHHEAYGQYPWKYEIEQTIDFLLNVVFNKTPGHRPHDFYCIVCALDGYVEACYPGPRTIPRRIGDIEYRNKAMIDMTRFRENEFPVFHTQKYVLGQSVRKHMPYTIAVVDRYYLCLHRYNAYRSVHQGIEFHTKIPRLVYAGNDRGSKFNFLKDRGVDMSQRAYFASDAVEKTNIDSPSSISREDMIRYKYILDIDGNACTWDATAWKLNSGSVIFKAESDWKQWFYDDYIPWTHYVPVQDDFGDVQEKLTWCEEHPSECLAMVANCKSLFQEIYKHENVVKYMEGVIDILVKEQAKTHAASRRTL